jgi:hypothetical protein
MKITTSKGQEVIITATLVKDEIIDRNMDIHKAVCEIKWTATVDGVNHAVYGGPRSYNATVNGKQIVAVIGKIALDAAQYAECMAMVDAIKADPYYAAWQAKVAANASGVAEYDRHADAVDSMMTLGGRSC